MGNRQERIAAAIDADAEEARVQGYESTAQVHEQRAADYRSATGQSAGGQQDTGQAGG